MKKGIAIQDFEIKVEHPKSTLNTRYAGIKVKIEKNDVLTITGQGGSLGDLWTINNLTKKTSYEIWTFNYKAPEFVGTMLKSF